MSQFSQNTFYCSVPKSLTFAVHKGLNQPFTHFTNFISVILIKSSNENGVSVVINIYIFVFFLRAIDD